MDYDSQRRGMDFDARQNPLEHEIWVVTRCVGVIPYRRFGTIYRSHIWGSILTSEDTTDKISRNVGKKLSLHAE
jgi:hypothetical protein